MFHRKFLSKIFHFNFKLIFLAKVCLPIFIQKLIFDRAWLDKKIFQKKIWSLSLTLYFSLSLTYTRTHTLHTHTHIHIHIHTHKQKNWKNEEKRISFRVRSWQQRQINEIPSIFFQQKKSWKFSERIAFLLLLAVSSQ